ncbi:hypothetical protein ATK36_0911 [Amycolatopsis sulphurea]|uniref:DUF6603 domain-containing protein n=1 Tax=Amycolatopsis sulphurea TaxID=76022 RepID=A0A2A9G2G3_9PSEU|nr:DUF6603 domain-containing protein [Amycolatopsis sulphurea]PFG57333.1 hypothetical protein ATK36_0911 [Amycolatopsis sulphurea]
MNGKSPQPISPPATEKPHKADYHPNMAFDPKPTNSGAKPLRVLLLRVKVKANLSSLPVVGPKIPPDLDVRLDSLQVVLGPRLDAGQAQRIDALIGEVGKDLPTLPEQGLPGGVLVGARIGIGKNAAKPLLVPLSKPATTEIATTGPEAPNQAAPIVWLDVKRTLGPVRVDRVGVSYSDGRLWLLVGAALSASGVELAVDGLGLGFRLRRDVDIEGRLDGLSVGYDRPPLTIAGALLNERQAPTSRYSVVVRGAAVVRTPALSVAAMGGYAQPKSGQPSLFLFGELAMKPGQGIGPPPFRVTGLALGFGYNSGVDLPELKQLDEFPLMPGRARAGEKPDLTVLKELGKWVHEVPGQVWVAAGLTVDSFRFISAQAVALVQVGEYFSIMLLGRATAQFPRTGRAYARVGLDLRALYRSSEDLLQLDASLSPGSFLISDDCRLTGGAAFYLWFGRSKHPGDFVFTIGGYHPGFARPMHYPDVERLGFSWSVSDQVSVRGEAYCALTPKAFMVGGRLAVNFHGGPVKAWFTAWLDALIEWSPLYFRVSIGITAGVSLDVWLGTLRAEVSVSLDLWGPPTGGIARIKALGITVKVKFGSGSDSKPALTWSQFREQLLPAEVVAAQPIAGLLAQPHPAAEPVKGAPWVVSSDGFTFTTRSAMPASELLLGTHPFQGGTTVDVRPTGQRSLTSKYSLQVWRVDGGTPVEIPLHDPTLGWQIGKLVESIPQALWGTGDASTSALDKKQAAVLPDRLVGFQVTVPKPELAKNPIASSRAALDLDSSEAAALPLPPSVRPVLPQPTVWRTGAPSRITLIKENIAGKATARTALHTVLAKLTPLADGPLTKYAAMVGNTMAAEPLLTGK